MTLTPTPHRPLPARHRPVRGAVHAPVPAGAPGADGQDRPGSRDGGPAARRAVPSRAPAAYVAGTALTILGALLLGLALDVAAVGRLRHARDQRSGYALLRGELANATAPVGAVAVGRPVAVLEIPSLGVREVVFEGTTSGVLTSGPGHRRDTPLPGQPGTSVLMGRAAGYGGPFGGIASLAPGETFTVTTGQGRHAYRVTAVRGDGDPQPAPPATGRVTLVTATGTPYVPAGVVRVDADLTSPAQPGVARPAGLLPSERALAGDRGALVPLLLWSQALLLAALALTLLRARWGRRQAWVAGVPVLAFLGLAVAGTAARLLPNLL